MSYKGFDLDPSFNEAQHLGFPLLEYLDKAAYWLLGKGDNPLIPWTSDTPMEAMFLQDVGYEDFFKVPKLVSGQSLDDVSAVYEALMNNGRGLDDGMETFQSACTNIFRNWTGEAQEACAKYGGAIMSYVNDERDAITRLAGAMLAYGAAIQSVREDWLKLAEQFLTGVDRLIVEESASDSKVFFTVVGALAGAAVTIASAGIGGLAAAGIGAAEAMTFFSASAGAAIAVGTEIAKEQLSGGSLVELVRSYLRACDELKTRLEDALDSEVAQQLAALRDERVAPPPCPIDVGKFDENPRKHLAPEHTTPAVDRWLKKKEEQANQQRPSTAVSSRLG